MDTNFEHEMKWRRPPGSARCEC